MRDGDSPQGDINDLYALLIKIKYLDVSLLQEIDTEYRRINSPVQHDPTNSPCVTEHIMLTEKGYAGKNPPPIPGLISDNVSLKGARSFVLAHQNIRIIMLFQKNRSTQMITHFGLVFRRDIWHYKFR